MDETNNPIFTIGVNTKGALISSFVFTDINDLNEWKKRKLPELEAKYGTLDLYEHLLPGLKVGNRCSVVGEGMDVFTITSLIKYEDHRFGFNLDSGWSEEVNKCYEAYDGL